MDSLCVNFHPVYIRTFMGGDFTIGTPHTVAELRQALQDMDKELSSWGDETQISELALVKDKIQITLVEGVPE